MLAILAKEVRFNGLPTPSPVRTGKRDLGLVERTDGKHSFLLCCQSRKSVGLLEMQSHAHQELFFKGPGTKVVPESRPRPQREFRLNPAKP